jgi:hypothetical protein
MKKTSKYLVGILCLLTVLSVGDVVAMASTSKGAKTDFTKLLLGKDVKALLDMPAYKDGLDLYFAPNADKRLDDRGLDLKELSKYLKDKGVGVERDEWATITDVKIDSDRIEIHLDGGGEGRGASKNANKKGAGFKRAGGSRINFRYGRDLTDADIQQDTFLPVMGRVLDTSRIREHVAMQNLSPEFKDAIQAKTIKEGMTYQMAMLSAGEPDQKKVDDSATDTLKETWYYLKDGHRWVVRFENGKVVKVQIF